MKMTTSAWLTRLMPFVAVLTCSVAMARVGGGEHYDSGREGSGSDDSGLFGLVFEVLIQLVFRHPMIGIPLLLIAVGAYFYMRRKDGSESTRKALDTAEASNRTTVAARDVDRWVSALKAKDPEFDLIAFLDRTRRLFLEVQEAWFIRSLEPVRRFLSDATFTRLAIQLKLIDSQGLRDAIADMQVLDLQIIGLEQSPFFDTVHVRVKAQLRDDDVPSSASDDQARATAQKRPLEPFTEVWSFVRKPGAVTKESQGTCPNCGAPFSGGASNQCEHCKAIVNSGNYDWVLAEVTQGSEFKRVGDPKQITGLGETRQHDPELNLEVLEDRGALCFWKWVDAQASLDAGRLSKIADPAFQATLKTELDALRAQGRKKVFLECTVGAVNTLALSKSGDKDLAHLEVRWSSRVALVASGQTSGKPPSMPQRFVLTLHRNATAQTSSANGLSTSRCPNCGAPLSDNASVSCEFCGTMLATGERDWVIRDISPWETWGSRRPGPTAPAAAVVVDQEERQRLLYLMAAMAAADGVVDNNERKLLKLCADRWSVPFANVELALTAGPALFDRLIVRGSDEAEGFLQELVNMALVDGRIDRKEKHLLTLAARHLQLEPKLDSIIANSSPGAVKR